MKAITTIAACAAILTCSMAVIAQPTVSLIWRGSDSNVIEASPGDYVTLDIVVSGDTDGIIAAQLGLRWDLNHLTPTSAEECPSPPHIAPELCYDLVSAAALVPLESGVPLYPGQAWSFDAGASEAVGLFADQSFVLGSIEYFIEPGTEETTISLDYMGELGLILDGNFVLFRPPAQAEIEPPGC